MTVLSASGLLVEDAVVAVSVVVTWPVVAVAVWWHAVVTVVSSVKSVLMSSLWAAVQSDLVVFLAVHVLFSSPDLLHHVSSFLAFISSKWCNPNAHLITVVPCETHRFLLSTPMTLAGPHPMALRLKDSLTCFPAVYCISRKVVTSHGFAPSN